MVIHTTVLYFQGNVKVGRQEESIRPHPPLSPTLSPAIWEEKIQNKYPPNFSPFLETGQTQTERMGKRYVLCYGILVEYRCNFI
jgi:hypothetical protein